MVDAPGPPGEISAQHETRHAPPDSRDRAVAGVANYREHTLHLRRRLRTALCTLSEPDRELLLLVAWEGLTSAEAAEVLGISKVATRSRLHRARHRALQALHADHDRSALTTPATREES